MAFRASMKKGVNVMNVVKNLIYTVIGLWIGGTLLMEVGTTMVGTCSPFYKGMSLIGWQLTEANSSGGLTDALVPSTASLDAACHGSNYVLHDTTSQAGILAVVGLIALAGVVLSFVKFKF